jgi:CheY-like chemotaxis protein
MKILYNTVFLADDDIDDLETLRDVLKGIDDNLQCFWSQDGEEALKILSDEIFQKPDLIFLDFNMPRLNGKQVLKQLKKNKNLRDIPVIMYSTFIGESDIDEMKKLGAVYVLTKATEFKKLVDSLMFILSHDWSIETSLQSSP